MLAINEEKMEQSAYDTLKNRFPKLKIDSISFFGEGETKSVYLVNDSIIFKLPKGKKDLKSFHKEKVALLLLKNKTDIPIPKLLYYDDLDKDNPIIGQSLMPGTPLSENIFDTFSQNEKSAFFREIGNFVSQIHKVNDMSQDIYTQSPEGNKNAIDGYLEAVNNVLSPQDRSFFSAITSRYKRSVDDKGLSLFFSHGDLQFQNILYNPQTNKISSIIDFGSACYADELYDIRYFWNNLNKDLMEPIGKSLTNEDRMRVLYYHLCTVSRNIHIAYEPDKRNYNNSTEIKKLLSAVNQR